MTDDVDALLEGLDEGQRQALRSLALAELSKDDSVEGFSAFFELMHGTPLHDPGRQWVENMYNAREKRMGLLQECFRESGKTTVFSKFFLLFQIGHHPEKVNMVVRINDDKATKTTAAIAYTIEHDPRWALVFPHVVPDFEKGWGAAGYEVRRNDLEGKTWEMLKSQSPEYPTFVGYGWKSGSIIGSRVNGILIVDDIHDRNNTSSATEMANVKEFVQETLEFCKMPGCLEVWNYTPWMRNDVYHERLATGTYLHSKTPVMVPSSEDDPDAKYWETTPVHPDYPDGPKIPMSGKWYRLAWPEAWDYERITKAYRNAGMVGFSRMMMLDLDSLQGVNLKKEWLHYFPDKEIDYTWPVYMGIDYASTPDRLKAKNRDYFALAIGRGIPGGGLVVTDGLRIKVSKAEAIQQVLSLWQLYPTLQLIGVESIGKGEEFYNDLALSQDIMGRIPPLVAIRHGRRSKGDRFENWLAPRFQASRIWISTAETPFLNAFVDEWLTWPNGEHDDTLDGVYMLARAAEGTLAQQNGYRTGTHYTQQRRKADVFYSAFGRQ